MNWKDKSEGSPENLPSDGNGGYRHKNTCPVCENAVDGYLPWHLTSGCEALR